MWVENAIITTQSMEKPLYYPIGEQDFKSLRDADCIYIDKTRYIELLSAPGSKYYFLARPRRFGKSLFLSTLRYFFEEWFPDDTTKKDGSVWSRLFYISIITWI